MLERLEATCEFLWNNGHRVFPSYIEMKFRKMKGILRIILRLLLKLKAFLLYCLFHNDHLHLNFVQININPLSLCQHLELWEKQISELTLCSSPVCLNWSSVYVLTCHLWDWGEDLGWRFQCTNKVKYYFYYHYLTLYYYTLKFLIFFPKSSVGV